MYKKISVVLLLILITLFKFPVPVNAAVQTGIECQINDNRIAMNSALVNYWFFKNCAVNVTYSWENNNLSSGIIFKTKPLTPYFIPYSGLGVRDLFGATGREIVFMHKLEFISGLEFDLKKLAPGFSMALEARIVPYNLTNTTDNNTGLGPILSISLNYTFGASATSDRSDIQVNDQDLYLLAKLITAEAGDEPYDGQVAVGAVVLNRVKSPDFPNTIEKVIYQPGQFSSLPKLPAITPSKSCIKAAEDALAGKDPSNGALYFYNPLTCSVEGLMFFTSANLQVTVRIGHHLFLK